MACSDRSQGVLQRDKHPVGLHGAAKRYRLRNLRGVTAGESALLCRLTYFALDMVGREGFPRLSDSADFPPFFFSERRGGLGSSGIGWT